MLEKIYLVIFDEAGHFNLTQFALFSHCTYVKEALTWVADDAKNEVPIVRKGLSARYHVHIVNVMLFFHPKINRNIQGPQKIWTDGHELSDSTKKVLFLYARSFLTACSVLSQTP